MSERLEGFEHELVEAARRRSEARRAAQGVLRRRSRRPLRSVLLAVVLGLGVAGSAGAATLFVLRDDVISPPAARDVAPEQMPARGTSRLAGVRAPDPDRDAPAWTVRLASSRTGLLCSTVGQRQGAAFGLVGLDGRFRRLPVRVTDGCGIVQRNAASLVGARVFDADQRAAVRTVVNGVGGTALRAVTVEAGGQRTAVKVGRGGTFILALRGYPEDLGIRVALRFADGHVERHPFGVSEFVVPDPAGSAAWRVQAFAVGWKPGESPNPRSCVNFGPAREGRDRPFSPSACGELGTRKRRGYFAAVRRIEPGTGSADGDSLEDGNWRDHPPRTAVWGTAGDDVRSITVMGPGSERRDLVIAPSRSFLAVYGPEVDPRALRLVVRFSDGRTETRRGSVNLVDGPVP